MNICVYGAASNKVADIYKEEVFRFGALNAKIGNTLVYGGGNCGLMGAVANGALSENGKIIGVVPRFIHEFEEVNLIGETHYVETMPERKSMMEDLADAFVIVPGGIGTMDEFFQILTLDYLKRQNKPIFFLNINGFYDNLSRFMETMVDQKFLTKDIAKFVHVENNPEDLVRHLQIWEA